MKKFPLTKAIIFDKNPLFENSPCGKGFLDLFLNKNLYNFKTSLDLVLYTWIFSISFSSDKSIELKEADFGSTVITIGLKPYCFIYLAK